MKLNSISLRHAHHFSDLNIEFKYSDKPITLILGDQSSGNGDFKKYLPITNLVFSTF